MTPEPLKGKIVSLISKSYYVWGSPQDGRIEHEYESCASVDDIKSAVEGLIKFHEDRIKELIRKLETIKVGIKDTQLSWGEKDWMFDEIDSHLESLMAIEHWLEDVI